MLSRKDRKVNSAVIAEFSSHALRNISLRTLREKDELPQKQIGSML
jgi:hypothetical protein